MSANLPPSHGTGFRLTSALRRLARAGARLMNLLLIVVMVAVAFSLAPGFLPGLGGASALKLLRQVFAPAVAVLHPVLPAGWSTYDRSALAFLLLLLLLRQLINSVIFRVSLAASRDREIELLRTGFAATADQETERQRDAERRRAAIETYAEAKALLESSQQDLTFLSLDIAGSTAMKNGEDPFLIEHAFLEYRALVERIVKRYRVSKAAWTPDGQMFAFPAPEAAVGAAQEILVALERFNREVCKLKQPFRLRAGTNRGRVSTDEATPMEQLSDHAIDVAGHLQKYATPGELWISGILHSRLPDHTGFTASDRAVDGHPVFVWKPPAGARA